MAWRATLLSLCIAGCVPAKSSDEGTTSADAAETTDVSPTDAPTSDGSAGTTTDSLPTEGEWLGVYNTGFGNAGFTACDDQGSWLATNLPRFPACLDHPSGIWMRLRGTIVEGVTGPELLVTKILEGPCPNGSCAGGIVMEGCGTLDWLCQELPGCSPSLQSCPAGQRCTGTGPEYPYGMCTPLDPEPGQIGDPCKALPDSCDTTLMCLTADLDTSTGVCAPLCIGVDLDECADPALVCEYAPSGVPVCVSP